MHCLDIGALENHVLTLKPEFGGAAEEICPVGLDPSRTRKVVRMPDA